MHCIKKGQNKILKMFHLGNHIIHRQAQTHAVGDFSVQIQQYAIIEDVLYVLAVINTTRNKRNSILMCA